jgi:hypothetical protein
VYNKIFTKILDSSIWLESNPTRIVWLTFLAAMDETGFAQFAAVGNLANRARVTIEEAEEAVRILSRPDGSSSDPENNGRRIERVDGGWIVLNAEKYRDIVTRAIAQQQTRDRVARFRARVKKEISNDPVTLGNGLVTPSEAYSDTDHTQNKDIHAEPVAPMPVSNMPIKPVSKTLLQIRVESLFRRRPTTPWSKGELKAWVAAEAVVADTKEEDWVRLEAWYALPTESAPYRRTDMAALLNNWHAEFTKAERTKLNGHADGDRKITSRSFESGKDVDYSKLG